MKIIKINKTMIPESRPDIIYALAQYADPKWYHDILRWDTDYLTDPNFKPIIFKFRITVTNKKKSRWCPTCKADLPPSHPLSYPQVGIV